MIPAAVSQTDTKIDISWASLNIIWLYQTNMIDFWMSIYTVP